MVWPVAEKNEKKVAADDDSGDDDNGVKTPQRLMADVNQGMVAGCR